jgi:hypothetical protein
MKKLIIPAVLLATNTAIADDWALYDIGEDTPIAIFQGGSSLDNVSSCEYQRQQLDQFTYHCRRYSIARELKRLEGLKQLPSYNSVQIFQQQCALDPSYLYCPEWSFTND